MIIIGAIVLYPCVSMGNNTIPVLITAGFICAALSSCSTEPSEPAASGSGTLVIQANGEDFVRQGFTTKDGWQIQFDHVYVTLAQVTAYQADPPFDPQKSDRPKANTDVSIDQPVTVDLAQGGTSAEPIQVGRLEAPAGRYNALSWDMVSAPDGVAQGYPLVMVGTAIKDGKAIDFSLKFSEELSVVCGDFIGDERKGFLNSGESADIEATFHFDHLFGDSETPAEDSLNTAALGFEPLAALATDGQLDVDSAMLKTQLSETDFQQLTEIWPDLSHVGEGHCRTL